VESTGGRLVEDSRQSDWVRRDLTWSFSICCAESHDERHCAAPT
jgi:hypothetical protein